MKFVSGKSLRIENIEILADEEVLCRNQSLALGGLYGVVGAYNRLRSSLMSLLTKPAILDIANLRFCADIFYKDQMIEYCELQRMMNPFIMFHSDESVRSSLELANFFGAKRLISVFDLTRVQNLPISKLSISESKAWEAAISVASSAKIIILRDFQSGHESKRKYLSFLKEYASSQNRVILVELDSPLEYELDGCVIIGKDSFKCIDFSTETGIYHYQSLYLKSLHREEKVYSVSSPENDGNTPEPPLSTHTCGDSMVSSCTEIPDKSKGNVCNGEQRKVDNFIDLHSQEFLEEDEVVYRIHPKTKSNKEEVRRSNVRNRRSKRKVMQGMYTDSMSSELRCRNNYNITTLKRIFTCYFYSIDLKSSLILARRRYIFKERKIEDLKRFFISILIQIYLTVLVKFKGSIAQNLFDFVYTIPRFLHLVLAVFKVGVSFLIDPVPSRSIKFESGVLYLASRFLCSLLSPLMLIGWKTKSFFALIRSLSWDSADYKIVSTGIYFLVFMKGGTIVNEEKAQIYNYINRMYSPGTYFAYIFSYLVLTTWIPVLIISYILNFTFALVFLITGTFICSFLNLISNMKLKYFCVCIILAFNLLYPLNSEQFQKGFFFKYSESFNLLVICREIPFISSSEQPVYVYRLLRAFLSMYLFFCYKLSKI